MKPRFASYNLYQFAEQQTKHETKNYTFCQFIEQCYQTITQKNKKN
jgi:hypothetical protein